MTQNPCPGFRTGVFFVHWCPESAFSVLSFPELGASAGLRRQKYSIKRKNFNDKNDKNNIRMRGGAFEMEARVHS
jgi:hypothetical protein